MHWLGTDNIGRDYLSRILFAGRITLTVAVTSVVISEFLGIVIGVYFWFLSGLDRFGDHAFRRIYDHATHAAFIADRLIHVATK